MAAGCPQSLLPCPFPRTAAPPEQAAWRESAAGGHCDPGGGSGGGLPHACACHSPGWGRGGVGSLIPAMSAGGGAACGRDRRNRSSVLACVDRASFLSSFLPSFLDSGAELLPPVVGLDWEPLRDHIFPPNANFAQTETTFPFLNPLPQALGPCPTGSIKQPMPFSGPAGVLGPCWEDERTHNSRDTVLHPQQGPPTAQGRWPVICP